LTLRDKIIQYPKIAVGSEHPVIDEGSLPELKLPVMLEKIKPSGTLAINAIHMSNIPELPYHLIYGERTLRSVANATYQDGVEFMKLAVEIPIVATTQSYTLEDANRALLDLKQSRINGEAVLVIGS